MHGKDFISLHDRTCAEVKRILDVGLDVKANPEKYADSLRQQTLAMLFEKPSLRTRVTFEVGMTQLGGHAIYLAPSDISLGKRESVPDVAKNLERWVDAIMARVFEHEKVTGLAEHAGVPVINGLSDLLHPCQVVADLLTLREKWDDLKGKRMAYVGDGNNMAHSLMFGCAKVGMHINVVCPESHAPKPVILEMAKADAAETGSEIRVVHDPKAGVDGADVVYTDVWASMGQEKEAQERKAIFAPFQVNDDLMACAKSEAFFMHCLPAHRGEEVTDSVIDSWRSIVFDEAENRLHGHKAIMLLLMAEEFVTEE